MASDMASAAAATSTPDLSWSEVKLSTRDFNQLSTFIEKEVGIQLPPTKHVMVESRLRKRLRALGLSNFPAYMARVFGPSRDEGELIHLVDAVTTNKTDFFREPHHFTYLAREALPALLAEGDSHATHPLTVWSAASSTGEEPFTLAMVLSEFAESHALNWQIVATDISTAVLDRARRAIYTDSCAEAIPGLLKRKYLLRSRDRAQGLVRIHPRLRQKVTFQRLNLLSRQYNVPRPIDVIFCRNVFIYFNRATQAQILLRFVDALRPGGFVFLGHSETTNGLAVPLVQIAPTIYQKAR
jgi:chemotaxis protein methyltransferase CheR